MCVLHFLGAGALQAFQARPFISDFAPVFS